MQLINGLRTLGVCLAMGIVTACGGGGSSSGGGGGPGTPGGPTKGVPGPGTISGVAHDGPIAGATINVYEWNGQRGRMLASTLTDSTGSYSLALNGPQRPVLLESVGGVYIEEATESSVVVPSGQALLAVQIYDPGRALISNLTYYSTLATGLAENLIKLGSPADEAVTTANARIADILGLDLSRTPAVVNNRQGLTAEAANSVELGFATAAISSLTQGVSIASDARPTAVINSIAFIQAAYDDIRTDGMLDGRGANGPIALGRVSVTPDTYRRQLALNILKIATNPIANRLQVNPGQLIAVASRLNNSTDPIFANAPVIPFDTDKPNIIDLSIGDGDILFGANRRISFSIQSFSALQSVKLLLNNAMAIDMTDPNAMIANLDTTRFPDGQFDFTIVATDVAGAEVRRTLKVTLNNLTAVMVSNTLKPDQFYNGVFDASFSISDPAGISMIQYLVDGVVQQTESTVVPFRLDTRKFADGQHAVTAQVTNLLGVVKGEPININIDNTPPEVTFSLADNSLTNQSNLALMISATDAVFNAPKLPNVANPAEFLLDGKNNPIPPMNISVGGGSVTFSQPFNLFDPSEGADSVAIPDGLHTFSFKVSDVLNTTVVTRRFTLDRTPPVVTVTSPTNCNISPTEGGANQCQTFSGIVTFRGTIVDSTSGVSPTVKLTLTGRDDDTGGFTAPLPGVPVFDVTLQPDSSFSVNVDTRTLPVAPNGLVGYVITSTDGAGNSAGRLFLQPTGVFRVLN